MITFLSKIIKLNNLHIIGIVRNDNEDSYNVLTVKKKRNKIEIVSSISFDNFEQLSQKIDLKIPVVLAIDGKGVLNKEIDFNNENDVSWYKNVDFNSIYHTSLLGYKSSFISFCRKNIADDITEKFIKRGFQVADLYVGSFLSALLYNAIKKDSIISNDIILEFEKGKLASFTKQQEAKKTETYTIGKENITSDFLPLYGIIIHFFIQSKEVSKTKNDTLNTDEIIYKKAFNVLGITMLVGFLTTLLISFFLIQYYGAKNAQLNLQNVYSNQSYQLILDLEKQKENKENLLKETGFLSTKFLSFYSYEIIKGIPSDISLTNLNVIPLSKEIKATQKISFEAQTIIVKGETFNESSFNSWMIKLKQMDWLKNFEIISFKKDKKNKSQFEIKITIKDV
ncbi:PilN domain-containing protein [Flavobacterium sp. 3-210]